MIVGYFGLFLYGVMVVEIMLEYSVLVVVEIEDEIWNLIFIGVVFIL